MVAVPPLRVTVVSCAKEPIPDFELPVVDGGVPDAGVATSDTDPVAVAGVTVTVKLTGDPCVILTVPVAGLVIATVSPVSDTDPHALTRFVTFNEPSPVARS